MCVFVCYKKGYVTFYPNNATFTQQIDDCMGRVITLFDRKRCRFELCLVAGVRAKRGLTLTITKTETTTTTTIIITTPLIIIIVTTTPQPATAM